MRKRRTAALALVLQAATRRKTFPQRPQRLEQIWLALRHSGGDVGNGRSESSGNPRSSSGGVTLIDQSAMIARSNDRQMSDHQINSGMSQSSDPARDRLRTRRKAAAGRNFRPAPTTIRLRSRFSQDHSSAVDHGSGPGISAADRVDHASQGNSGGNSRPPLDLHRPIVTPREQPGNSSPAQRGMSPDTIRRPSTMSLATIRLRRAVNLAAHTQVRLRIAQQRRRLILAQQQRRWIFIAQQWRWIVIPWQRRRFIVTRWRRGHSESNRAPAPTTARARHCLQIWSTKTERATDNQPSLISAFKDETVNRCYQTPLSLPVILNATAAAEASGGNRLSRNVAGTLPLKAAWVICFV